MQERNESDADRYLAEKHEIVRQEPATEVHGPANSGLLSRHRPLHRHHQRRIHGIHSAISVPVDSLFQWVLFIVFFNLELYYSFSCSSQHPNSLSYLPCKSEIWIKTSVEQTMGNVFSNFIDGQAGPNYNENSVIKF